MAYQKNNFWQIVTNQVVDHIYAKLEIIPLTIYPDRATLSEPQETRLQRQSRLNDTIYEEGYVMINTSLRRGSVSMVISIVFIHYPSTGNRCAG